LQARTDFLGDFRLRQRPDDRSRTSFDLQARTDFLQ
jgi:hypothetical protein